MKLDRIDSASKRNELIRDFYIPNTREDIYEFFILAASNIEAGGKDADAWYAKLDQAYKKAEIVLGEGRELERLKSLRAKSGRTRRFEKFTEALFNNRAVQSIALFAVGAILFGVGEFFGSASGDPDSPYYAFGILGLFPVLGAMLLFVSSILGEKQ